MGRALGWVRQTPEVQGDEPLLWALGVALAANVSNWLGISYFDQFNVLWLLQLAALVSLSEFCLYQAASDREAADASEVAPALSAINGKCSEAL